MKHREKSMGTGKGDRTMRHDWDERERDTDTGRNISMETRH